jgi:hypothetical protein
MLLVSAFTVLIYPKVAVLFSIRVNFLFSSMNVYITYLNHSVSNSPFDYR